MRKGLYAEWLKEENLVLLRGWARNGLTMEQIAKNIGISRKTLNEWMKKYPEIERVIKSSREKADLVVENELFRRTQGYTATVKKHIKVRREELKNGVKMIFEELVPVEEEVHIPGDVNAQKFWLSHRKPEDWGKLSEEQTGKEEETAVVEIPGVVESTE